MLFEVVGARDVRELSRTHAYAVITVTAPRAKRLVLRPDPKRVATIWRMFDDVGHAYAAPRDPHASYFAPSDADALLDFVEDVRDRATTCVIACDAGEGRSRGVALGLALAYGDATEHLALGRPNTHVVRTLVERFSQRTATPIAMPCIVRYLRRCPRHPARTAPAAAVGGPCDLCGGRHEPVPVDIATDTVVGRAAPRPHRSVAAAP